LILVKKVFIEIATLGVLVVLAQNAVNAENFNVNVHVMNKNYWCI
jgi:hypothetical protein